MTDALTPLIESLRLIITNLRSQPWADAHLQSLRRILFETEDRLSVFKKLRGWVAQAIMLLDARLRDIACHIIEAPRFKKLEASWRGLRSLVQQNPDEGTIRIRVLNVKWSELSSDAQCSLDFEQSALFRRIYSEEYGMPGGIPFGLLVADFEVNAQRVPGQPIDDVAVLDHVSQVGSAAFAPLLIGISPKLFGLNYFGEANLPLSSYFDNHDPVFHKWRAFQRSEASRFVGATLPRVLVRTPYREFETDFFASGELASNATAILPSPRNTQDKTSANQQNKDSNHASLPGQNTSGQGYLWGNAVYPTALVVMRSFAETGWYQDITGVDKDTPRGGRMDGMVVDRFSLNGESHFPKFSTDLLITDRDEMALSRLGIIALCRCKWSEFTAIYNCPSLHLPIRYDSIVGTRNEEISSNLSLVLCVSRFAHYIKVMARDWIGSALSMSEVQTRLNRWLAQYISPAAPADGDRYRYPLRAASIELVDVPANPRSYACRIRMQPHLYGVEAKVMTVFTEIPRAERKPVAA
ncbi:MAG: hypothetical protein CMJ77_06390 [Planctomycetaceae bacterium]|nr:hypothetical protein [Planctomycetaceae bacterium]